MSKVCLKVGVNLIMAEEGEEVTSSRKLLSKASVGCTDFPRVALSFKWVINYAKPLMSCECELKSPYFKTPLPDRDRSSSWYLLLQYVSLVNRWPSKQYFSINLCFEDVSYDTFAHQFLSCCITDCTFSILNSKTNEVKYSVAARSVLCTNSKAKCGYDEFILKAKLDEFLPDDGVLTIQVAASLIYTNPVHGTYRASCLPLHNALEGLKKLHQERSYSDITIKCGEKEFEAHKAILASQSPVFNRMFETDMKEKADNVIEITDVDPSAMSELLAFLYTGSTPKIGILAKELLYAACKYELPQLVQLCENELMMNLNTGNLLEMIQCADMHRALSLKIACLRMIKCHSAELFRSETWRDFKANSDKELAYEILEFHGLSC